MVPQLARVAHPFGVTVMSGGGFDSTTDRHNFAAALAGHDRPTEVLHIGDHDPSGVSMFLAFLEDVEAFTRELGGSAIFTRLAVTPQQIGEYRLPTAPPKATDRRPFAGETCQAEALPPDVPRQHPAHRHRGARRSARARSRAAPGAAHPPRIDQEV